MNKLYQGAGAILLLVCASVAWAGDVREQGYDVGTDVDAQGNITATQIDKDVPQSIAALLKSSLQQWKFQPAKRGDKAVASHTSVRMVLRAAPDASGRYHVRISYAGNGPRYLTRLPTPKYPPRAVAAHQSEFVVLNAVVQANGRLGDMVVTSQFKDWPMHSWFESSVLAAARHWHFEPETVDGTPVATHVRIPVTFTSPEPNFTQQQLGILRKDAAKQDADDAKLAGTDISLPSEQTVALDSPLKPSHVADVISTM